MDKYVDVTTDPQTDPNLRKYCVFLTPVLGQSEGHFLKPDPSGFLVHLPNPDDPSKMIIVLIGPSNIAGLYAKTSKITIATSPRRLSTNGRH